MVTSKILFVPGRIPFDSTLELNEREFRDHTVVLGRKIKNGWHKFSGKLLTYDDLNSSYRAGNSAEELALAHRGFHYLVSDPRTSIIIERCQGRLAWFSQFDSWRWAHEKLRILTRFLCDLRPVALLFQATPHGDWEWLLGKMAEYLDIPVLMFQKSALPWRVQLVKDIDDQVIQRVSTTEMSDIEPQDLREREWKLTERYIELNSGSYKDAVPEYVQAKLKSRQGSIWSWRKELTDSIKSPRSFPAMLQRYQLYRECIRQADSTFASTHQKNVTLLLHYQPERTSIPEGGIWCQQALIAQTISSLLPDGWQLRIKEHPSTFVGPFTKGYRVPGFYKELSELPNVVWVPIEHDTFHLIDQADVVATITGTVGVQSLIRAKPVLVFGSASYRAAPGVYSITDIDSLIRAMREITGTRNERGKLTQTSDLSVYWQRVMDDSVTGRGEGDYDDPITWNSPSFKTTAQARLVARLLRLGSSNLIELLRSADRSSSVHESAI